MNLRCGDQNEFYTFFFQWTWSSLQVWVCFFIAQPLQLIIFELGWFLNLCLHYIYLNVRCCACLTNVGDDWYLWPCMRSVWKGTGMLKSQIVKCYGCVGIECVWSCVMLARVTKAALLDKGGRNKGSAGKKDPKVNGCAMAYRKMAVRNAENDHGDCVGLLLVIS